MILTTESLAWAVTCSAGATAGALLGVDVNVATVGAAGVIAAAAGVACARLVRYARISASRATR